MKLQRVDVTHEKSQMPDISFKSKGEKCQFLRIGCPLYVKDDYGKFELSGWSESPPNLIEILKKAIGTKANAIHPSKIWYENFHVFDTP